MMKMESTKSRHLRWLDCFLGPMNSNSKWHQENLEENVGRKQKMIEDSDADSFAEKVEMYNESRQELNNLVDHGRGELILNNIPNSGLIPSQISISNVSSRRPLLSQLRSSKQPNAPQCSVVSKQLSEKRQCRKKKKSFKTNLKMKKMESKKLQRPRWLNSLFGPKNSNSQWLQENLEEMNRNFRRMLTIIEDSNAVSFAKKFEMYDQSRQELINLVDKCYRIHCLLTERYNHETGELLNNIPNSGLIPSQAKAHPMLVQAKSPCLFYLNSVALSSQMLLWALGN
ncbi:hypothetical protein H5410_034510 [Solanum commersonii]|uniref:NAB domain-containing protein n=1 Tax=Solanum commersonii TaxID=4109 RepID=A0A9J5YVQ2_SOLCO|nr:hypothetical protein H5410_034510 [Solanum commersonii]